MGHYFLCSPVSFLLLVMATAVLVSCSRQAILPIRYLPFIA
jgi:hypothetical protein